MHVVVERCAGLDVHRDDVVATVRVPGAGRRRWDQQTRTFRATLAGLAALGEWLAEAGVTLVGMEATGVYWKTVFQALEERFECWLLNAQHLHNVPGRKTAHVDRARGEVDVVPDQAQHLGDAQARVENRRDHQSIPRRADRQQSLDLIATQHTLATTRWPRALVRLELVNRVGRDPAVAAA